MGIVISVWPVFVDIPIVESFNECFCSYGYWCVSRFVN